MRKAKQKNDQVRVVKEQMKPQDRQVLLMKAFGFNRNDLEINSLGRISERQNKGLRKLFLVHLIQMIVLAVLAVIPYLLFAGTVSLESESEWFMNVLILSPLALLSVLIVIFGLFRYYRRSNDVMNNAISRIQGLAVVESTSDKAYPTLTVNDFNFNVTRKQIARIKHLEPHVVYYLPGSKLILSVEALDS